MKRIFNQTFDCTDYLLSNNIENVANIVLGLSDMAKTASVHSTDDIAMLNEDEVALILYHPNIGELKKFACDDYGITEININLLSDELNSLPEEIIKVAANNLGYVASNMGINIPENLQVYQTGDWVDPYVDTTHLNKVAFYQKLQDNAPEEVIAEVEKVAGKYVLYNTDRFSPDLLAGINARLKMTHNEKIAELYEDIRDNHSNYTPEEVCRVIDAADNMGNMDRAIKRGMFKGAVATTFELIKLSWYQENIELLKLKENELTYLSNFEKSALFGEEGEDVFNSLPKPTKDRLIKEATLLGQTLKEMSAEDLKSFGLTHTRIGKKMNALIKAIGPEKLKKLKKAEDVLLKITKPRDTGNNF